MDGLQFEVRYTRTSTMRDSFGAYPFHEIVIDAKCIDGKNRRVYLQEFKDIKGFSFKKVTNGGTHGAIYHVKKLDQKIYGDLQNIMIEMLEELKAERCTN